MGKYARRQLRFRTGQIGAGGSRPINEHSRTITTVCASQFGVSATTAGDTGTFDLTQWGQPCSMASSTTFAEQGTGANHPSEHPEIVAGGWDEARVLSSMYRFDIRFVGTDSAKKDFVFAWKFGTASTAAIVLTALDVTIDAWKDIRQSRGWVWKRFSGTNSGGSVYPSQGRVEIKVPSVWKLAQGLEEDEIEWQDLQILVQDATTTAVIRPFLHVVILAIDGTAFLANDVKFDITVFQKVKLYRNQGADEMVDEADQVT